MELLLILFLALQSLFQGAGDARSRADFEGQLRAVAIDIVDIAIDPAVDAVALAAEAEGRGAAAAGDWDKVRATLADLSTTRDLLRARFDVRIIADQTADPGIWRVPNAAPTVRNYYLIVEAIGPDGTIVTRSIESEEDGTVRAVSRWGVRVSEETWNAVAADLNNDGIIQNDLVGEKERGELDVNWVMPVLGGAITEW